MSTTLQQWKGHLFLYQKQVAIRFPDRQERARVLEALWEDPNLYGMPRDYADALTMVVPDEAVPLLRERNEKWYKYHETTGYPWQAGGKLTLKRPG